MQDLAKLGMLVSCLLAIYVGGRTLWIWRRTHRVQELSIGINVLAIAIGAAILTTIGVLGERETGSAPLIPHALGRLGLAAHVSALFVGTWKIFRADARWPIVPVAIAHGLLLLWLAIVLTPDHFGANPALLFQPLRGAGMAWAMFECFRYSAMLTKRAALGLADPLVAHRIWLWGFSAAASFAHTAIEVTSELTRGAAFASTPVGLNVAAALGLIGSLGIALAFFPPDFYQRAVKHGRATQAA